MPLIPDDHRLFVVDLHYVQPIEEIDPLIDAHIAFLKSNYAAGRFLASGAKVPRTGGVIIAVAKDRSEIEACLPDDPFHQHGIAEYTITEFNPTMIADGLR